ncbi:MAG: hypothetical protein ACTHJL_13440 [Amnibacterium sp.]
MSLADGHDALAVLDALDVLEAARPCRVCQHDMDRWVTPRGRTAWMCRNCGQVQI